MLSVSMVMVLTLLAAALWLPVSAQRVDSYWRQRLQLLNSEQRSGVGGELALGKRERQLSRKLLTLKQTEFDREPFFAAQHFRIAREPIRRSPVFRMIRDMPKGAILHLHDLSALSVEKTVKHITYMDHLYICNSTKLRLQFFNSPDSSCAWQLLNDLREKLGAVTLDSWLEEHLTVQTSENADEYADLKEVWSRFSSLMQTMLAMLVYERAWSKYIQLAIEEIVQDNVSYFELRTVLPQLTDLEGRLLPVDYTVQVFSEAFKKFQRMGKLPLGAKLIFAPTRKVTYGDLALRVDLALNLFRKFPDLIAGFDLVGEEDLGKPLVDFVPELLRLVEAGVPTFYHAGETYWQGTNVDENLFDAVLLNTSRLGHGYALMKHPAVLTNVIAKDIAIEVCPISNQVLGLVSDLRNHPAVSLLATGAPVVISSDDPGSWGASGLSYDFYVAFMTMTGRRTGLAFLKKLALNSIRYSALSENDRDIFMNMWAKKWKIFVHNYTSNWKPTSTNGSERLK